MITLSLLPSAVERGRGHDPLDDAIGGLAGAVAGQSAGLVRGRAAPFLAVREQIRIATKVGGQHTLARRDRSRPDDVGVRGGCAECDGRDGCDGGVLSGSQQIRNFCCGNGHSHGPRDARFTNHEPQFFQPDDHAVDRRR